MTINEELEKEYKNQRGRPRKYETAEELEVEIVKYFQSFVYNGAGEIIGKKPTVAGLALALGFESRQSIYDYAEEGAFSYIIKKAFTKTFLKYDKSTVLWLYHKNPRALNGVSYEFRVMNSAKPNVMI